MGLRVGHTDLAEQRQNRDNLKYYNSAHTHVSR